jgi:Zn-finger nucleic acid-binding protein
LVNWFKKRNDKNDVALSAKPFSVTDRKIWKCPKCGTILKKGNLDFFLQMEDSLSGLEGNATCQNCGSSFSQRDIYSGLFDIVAVGSTGANPKTLSMVTFYVGPTRQLSKSDAKTLSEKLMKQKFPHSELEQYFIVDHPNDLTKDEAYAWYQTYVAKGTLPNLGQQVDWQIEKHKGNNLVALYFC